MLALARARCTKYSAPIIDAAQPVATAISSIGANYTQFPSTRQRFPERRRVVYEPVTIEPRE
ncbi:MAG TPA: hypothetical protein PKL84_15550, partial [Candidatus Hydrogenedentes bacterium]|nr:hypothetical protein [Candidatus Hydrogenedentota bacterium]